VALPTPKDFRERPAIHVMAGRAMSAWACSGTSERQLLPKTDLHLRLEKAFCSSRATHSRLLRRSSFLSETGLCRSTVRRIPMKSNAATGQ
jgi:hypothetical protein